MLEVPCTHIEYLRNTPNDDVAAPFVEIRSFDRSFLSNVTILASSIKVP